MPWKRRRALEASRSIISGMTANRESDEDHSTQELETTADHWRQGLEGTKAEDSAKEVARGAEQGAEQPDYGIEGN